MKNVFNNRKILYFVLSVVLVSVFALTIAYATLSASLQILGSTEVIASNWNIYLDNVQVKNGSVSADTPIITDSSTLSFDVDLNKPGDYYEFTVDVVNNGTIDAMIDSVVMSPTLTSEQAKYVLYEVSYANGESISSKQILNKKTSTPVKVRVQYRKDLNASDLPTLNDKLNLNITFVYIQSDNNGSSIPNNGVSIVNVISGDGTQVGDEICIKDECFYVISSTDETVTMLAKYNLHVGNSVGEDLIAVPLENPTGIQDENALGSLFNEDKSPKNIPWLGTISFSSSNYWSSTVSLPAEVYSSESLLYSHIENYKLYLSNLGISISEARLIYFDELLSLGCSKNDGNCSAAPNFIFDTTYWTGYARVSDYVFYVSNDSYFGINIYTNNFGIGVRPVIVISRNLI